MEGHAGELGPSLAMLCKLKIRSSETENQKFTSGIYKILPLDCRQYQGPQENIF